jgi:hypothetical protein
MRPEFIPHASYQDFLLEQLRLHYSGGILVVHKDDWPLIAKLWITDLSPLTTLLRPHYDDKGPQPRDPASMFRSYLLYLLVRPEIGITDWVREMHRVPLYAILSGFHPGDIPGVGTFYDFFPRLWASERKHATPRVKSTRWRRGKPKKGEKGEKSPTKPGRVKRLVEWLLPRIDQKKSLPSDRLFEFFQSQFLAVSANFGLLGDLTKLNAAGDGTPIATASLPRSKPTCHCRAQVLRNAIIPASIPSRTATPGGTARGRNTSTDTMRTSSAPVTARMTSRCIPGCSPHQAMIRSALSLVLLNLRNVSPWAHWIKSCSTPPMTLKPSTS